MSSNYRDLVVWQKSMVLVRSIYQATDGMPDAERYGLTSQIRRAAVSIPCNIAEGQDRLSSPAFANHLGIARGSVLEVETLLTLIRDLYHDQVTMNYDSLSGQTAEVKRMLAGLIASLGRNTNRYPER
jgi:four helix bundle protein